jgi:isoquinoline 1-oxidoreductase beta subunit
LHMRISGQSILASVLPSRMDKDGRDPVTFQGLNPSGETAFGYSVPNLLIDHAMRNPHVPAGFWRGVNVNHNAIYVECFMDELAHSIGVDALDFRRKLMSKNPKNLAVLNAAAERIGWGQPAEKGRFRGLSQMMAFGSYVAGAAEISVDGDKIKIHKLIGATDPGYAVNPAQIDRQVAGSFVYALSALFYGEITVKDGAVEQGNFDTYNSLRIAEMPPVESILMPSGYTPWGGVGEPTILVAAPAVMNAYFNATGKRIRSFPLKNHNLQIA